MDASNFIGLFHDSEHVEHFKTLKYFNEKKKNYFIKYQTISRFFKTFLYWRTDNTDRLTLINTYRQTRATQKLANIVIQLIVIFFLKDNSRNFPGTSSTASDVSLETFIPVLADNLCPNIFSKIVLKLLPLTHTWSYIVD